MLAIPSCSLKSFGTASGEKPIRSGHFKESISLGRHASIHVFDYK